jgi:hypothetical protein
LFLLIFGFGVIALAALFMRLFIHKIMSTCEQAHQVIIGGDFNEEITNINTTTRQQYVVEFMAEHQMYTKEMGPTFNTFLEFTLTVGRTFTR